MSDLPEIRAEIDERGRMTYHATCEGVLLSKDEQDAILQKYADLQSENANLRELCKEFFKYVKSNYCGVCEHISNEGCFKTGCWFDRRMRELGIEVDE